MVGSSMRMQQIIAADRRRAHIRQEREGVIHPLRMTMIGLDRVDTDRHHLHPACGEISEPFLKTPQLGVTQRSPMPPIENQDNAVLRNQIGKRDWPAVLIRQRETRRFFTNAGCLS